MLCASAARLAQSKGLHRQPSRAWNLPRSEMLHRNWVFWAVYYYDKNIALRSGRPSVWNHYSPLDSSSRSPCLTISNPYFQAFDDDEISCEIPKELPDGGTLDIEVVTAAIEHARICAKISKQLLSVQAFNQSPTALFEIIEMLDERLQLWWNSLPNHITLTKHSDYDHWRSRNSFQRKAKIIRLHYLYWGSIIALHANVHYPWISSVLTRQEPFFEDRISKSSARSAEASRQILSTLKDCWFDMSFSSP